MKICCFQRNPLNKNYDNLRKPKESPTLKMQDTPKGLQRDSRKVSDLKVCSEHPETESLYFLLR